MRSQSSGETTAILDKRWEVEKLGAHEFVKMLAPTNCESRNRPVVSFSVLAGGMASLVPLLRAGEANGLLGNGMNFVLSLRSAQMTWGAGTGQQFLTGVSALSLSLGPSVTIMRSVSRVNRVNITLIMKESMEAKAKSMAVATLMNRLTDDDVNGYHYRHLEDDNTYRGTKFTPGVGLMHLIMSQ